MDETFEIELTTGEKKQAKLLTRIKPDNKDIEYIYYSIEETDDNVSILASKIILENGKEVMKNLDSEEERQDAYKVFSETYKKLREQNQE
jgi:hypothetical protein